MIDLHSHTTSSDGTDSPGQLLEKAYGLGVRSLAITDHDTFDGVDTARREALPPGMELICGIELSTRVGGESEKRRRNAHLLGYFFQDPGAEFRQWLLSLRGKRRERNGAIAERLRALGFDIHLEEAEALGRNVTARPHFAAVMIRKGYVPNLRYAFDRYLGEDGSAYVEREDPPIEEAIQRVHDAGGATSLAHAIRLNQSDPVREEELISGWASAGLDAIEVWHPDHDAEHEQRYAALAARCGLASTGGSDYHGDHTPGVQPGIGDGRLCVPCEVLDNLRDIASRRAQLRLPGIQANVSQSADGVLHG
jgi:predicted metal-dependent phosphoesterase TrpH